MNEVYETERIVSISTKLSPATIAEEFRLTAHDHQ